MSRSNEYNDRVKKVCSDKDRVSFKIKASREMRQGVKTKKVPRAVARKVSKEVSAELKELATELKSLPFTLSKVKKDDPKDKRSEECIQLLEQCIALLREDKLNLNWSTWK